MEADGLGRKHARRIPAHAPESVTVGADQEIDVGRGEDPAQAQMAGPLVGRIIGVRALPEKASVPSEVKEVAVESAGQTLAVRRFLDRRQRSITASAQRSARASK